MKHFEGQYYHLYNRGVNRQPIFASDENYLFLLRKVKQFLPLYKVTIITYCLMPNHYHFLLRSDEDGAIASFIQRLFNSYTQAFNKQQSRSGTLFEGRVKSKLIDKTEYLLHISRYIHLNPVKAGLAVHPAGWTYSNYLEWVGKRAGRLYDAAFVQDQFDNGLEYEKFVLAGLQDMGRMQFSEYLFD